MTKRSPEQLREDVLAIFAAAIEGVRSDRLVAENVRVDGGTLYVADATIELARVKRIVVVGAGKAGAGMAAGLEKALGPELLTEKDVTGWVNVPAGCERSLSKIHLHPARPAGINEPTETGVEGTRKILELVRSCTADDLCLCLISGGGSALLPAPISGISLSDKQAITRLLSGAGANIEELNTVRKQLSQIKGGGLARACKSGRLISLIISDVIGDPLDIIASGPTVPNTTTANDALNVLQRLGLNDCRESQVIIRELEKGRMAENDVLQLASCDNFVIGNIAVAVDAAGMEAERRGYSHAMTAARQLEGEAEDVGRHLAQMAIRMRVQKGPDCLITGGEPIVKLAPPDIRGKGGRNQQLVLAALEELRGLAGDTRSNPLTGIALASGGTDGEDGPTDAAGAYVDAELYNSMQEAHLVPSRFLRRNDSYHFFETLHGLIVTGPTDTNVCDVRVVVVDRVETSE